MLPSANNKMNIQTNCLILLRIETPLSLNSSECITKNLWWDKVLVRFIIVTNLSGKYECEWHHYENQTPINFLQMSVIHVDYTIRSSGQQNCGGTPQFVMVTFTSVCSRWQQSSWSRTLQNVRIFYQWSHAICNHSLYSTSWTTGDM